jgi:RNA polymerase sigma-70 factor (ECF subfamily)
MRFVVVNGQAGAVLLDGGGRAVVVVALDIADDLVQSVRAISNPEKLRHLDAFVDAPRHSPRGSPS